MKKIKFKCVNILLALTIITVISACEKYDKEANYAILTGSFTDVFTSTKLDVGNITLNPSQVTNGNMILDTAGDFQNTRILPGEYKIYGSIKAAFNTDSLSIILNAGEKTNVNLKIEPWISVLSSVKPVIDTTAHVQFTIQGNNSLLPSKHLVSWSSSPNPTLNVYTNPTNERYFVTPEAGNESGTFNYKIVGLKWDTVYFIRCGATIEDPVLNVTNDYNYGRQMIIKTPKKP